MVVVDGVARLLPGVLGNEQSAQDDSFADGLFGISPIYETCGISRLAGTGHPPLRQSHGDRKMAEACSPLSARGNDVRNY